MSFKNLGGVEAGSVPGYNLNPDLPSANDEQSWKASVATSLLATFAQEN